MEDRSEFLPRGALLFILVLLVVVSAAWLAMYALLLSRGWH